MTTLSYFLRIFAAGATGLWITSYPLFAQIRVKASDINHMPEKYYMQKVILEGKVVNSRHIGMTFRGYYTLKCNFGETVDIQSDNLPPMGYKFRVTAIVKHGKETQSFRLEEISRKKPGSQYGLWILSAMIAITGVILVASLNNTSRRATTNP